jgi:lipoprotein-anchoring transpeptidase ErfK/SrfK
MKLRMLFLAAFATLAAAFPAAAEVPNAYGFWTGAGSIKKSKPIFGNVFGQPQKKVAKKSKKKIKVASLDPNFFPGKPKALLSGGGKPSVSAQAPTKVKFSRGAKAGTVIVDQSEKKLYYVLGGGQAYAYPVAVGKKGFKWTGTKKVSRVASWPDWVPPAEMRQRKPHLPLRMTGGVNNPLGAKAIYLGSSLYRIHGTNAPGSIGTEASSGCIRMHNGHVVHLSKLISNGTTVRVVN